MATPVRRRVLAGAGLLALALAFTPGCKVGYLLKSGYYQAELLSEREPIDELTAAGRFSAEEQQKLALIADVKSWGADIGMQSTDNYETIAIDWKRQIWNVSACDPTAFEPKRWWFPVVGSFPYLGFFKEEDARELEAELLADGYDVYVRTAGAYSTLGWFKDPILPKMLTWSDFGLADTVLHELAHSTLWIPGSVKFNESYANFVGEIAAMRYLAERRGVHDPTLVEAVRRQHDRGLYREILHGLYKDLDAVYTDDALTEADKLARKQQLFGDELPARIEGSDILEPKRYLEAATKGPWNNARMIQFKTYNSNEEAFSRLLEEEGGDLLAFIARVEEVTDGQRKDPSRALKIAVGMPVEDDKAR